MNGEVFKFFYYSRAFALYAKIFKLIKTIKDKLESFPLRRIDKNINFENSEKFFYRRFQDFFF